MWHSKVWTGIGAMDAASNPGGNVVSVLLNYGS
jgi:hypothetical protein